MIYWKDLGEIFGKLANRVPLRLSQLNRGTHGGREDHGFVAARTGRWILVSYAPERRESGGPLIATPACPHQGKRLMNPSSKVVR